jgi:AcrR family transcriptional regulator
MNEPVKAPTSRNPAVVKARILDAAQSEFMAEGFAGASTNRMLELFGGSKPTMFRHFPTKRALFEGVVARIASRWSASIDWQHIETDEPETWLRAFGKMALDWILTEENIFVGRMAISEGASFPGVGQVYRTLAVEPIENVLSQQLARWTEAGLMCCTDAELDAVSFLDLALSGAVSRRLYRVSDLENEGSREHHVARVVELFLNGRRKVATPTPR